MGRQCEFERERPARYRGAGMDEHEKWSWLRLLPRMVAASAKAPNGNDCFNFQKNENLSIEGHLITTPQGSVPTPTSRNFTLRTVSITDTLFERPFAT